MLPFGRIRVISMPRATASLPKHLAEIGAEAFEACGSLCTVALPQQLRYIGHRAFAGCSQLVCLTYRSTKVNRRRLQVAANAFEGCHALTIPGGICYLSMRGKQVTQRRISGGGREVFFPRVRTPCGRSAQVIIEREGNTT